MVLHVKRKAYNDLLAWKNNGDRKPLVVLGCRQVGKTHLVRAFGDAEYDVCIYLNFSDSPNDRLLFEGELAAEPLMEKIVMGKGSELVPGRTLIILDEIQDCDDAYFALKPLSFDDRVDVIATGSFLGVLLNTRKRRDMADEHRVSPMGYVEFLHMHPMDFEEFCWATGMNPEIIVKVTESLNSHQPVDPFFHKLMQDVFRRYLVVGGMPAAVKVYSETRDYGLVRKQLDRILDVVRTDSARYSSKIDMMRVFACMESIPSQLANEKRSFQYVDVEKIKGAGKRVYGSSIDWLINSGLVLRCHNLLSVDPPLNANMEDDTYKLYMCDTGLLMALSRYQDVQEIVMGDPFINNGILMENAIANALHRKGYPLYYHAKKNSTLEVDFVLRYEGRTCIMEVKSGRKKHSKSLNTLLREPGRNRMGVKVCSGNHSVDENGAVHMPLYGPCLMKPPQMPDIPPVDIEGANMRFIEGPL